MRYGLLDYLIWIVFLGSAIASLLNSERWEIFAPLVPKDQTIDCITFSEDERYVAILVDENKLRLLRFPEMQLVWESRVDGKPMRYFHINFKKDGSEIILSGTRGVSLGTKYIEIHAKVSNGGITELNSESPFNIKSEEFYSSYFTRNQDYYLRKYSYMDEFGAVVFHARYPDGWIGQLYRPEVIVTLLAGLALLYRIIRIRLSKG